MCVDVRIVKWLLQNDHDATHLRDQGLQRMPNGEIFEKAKPCGLYYAEKHYVVRHYDNV
jgi:hypothetical protein